MKLLKPKEIMMADKSCEHELMGLLWLAGALANTILKTF